MHVIDILLTIYHFTALYVYKYIYIYIYITAHALSLYLVLGLSIQFASVAIFCCSMYLDYLCRFSRNASYLLVSCYLLYIASSLLGDFVVKIVKQYPTSATEVE